MPNGTALPIVWIERTTFALEVSLGQELESNSAMKVHFNSASLVRIVVAAVVGVFGLTPKLGWSQQSANLERLPPVSPAFVDLQVQPATLQTELPRSVEPPADASNIDFGTIQADDLERFSGQFSIGSRPFDVGTDLYSPPEFEGGLMVAGPDVAMKIGGYVKADFIYDFDPIDATDSFNTTTIPVGAAPSHERPLSRATVENQFRHAVGSERPCDPDLYGR